MVPGLYCSGREVLALDLYVYQALSDNLEPWRRITIPHDKRKYPQPMIHESRIELRGYDGEVRQIIVRGNGRERPTFLITNDFEMPSELLVGNYARRWRVENGIAEAVKFFVTDN